MAKIITFGEIMLRLAPEGCERFVQAGRFGAAYGGGEANVAVSLAGFGMEAAFVTRVPAHEIGQAAVNALRRYGVDTSRIARGGKRLGLYFLEKGAGQRPSKVIYDRADSAITTAAPEDFDWEKIFAGADWFHFTGITPALGDNAAGICLAACKAAKAANLTVSCDLNYRKNLWSCEKAGQVMAGFMKYIDVFIANEEHARDLFGIKAECGESGGGMIGRDACKCISKQLADRFNFTKVAITLRESLSANDNHWTAMIYDGGDFYFSKKYAIHIVDRVGSGDSFCAGLIYTSLTNMPPQQALDFSVAAAVLKHSIEGDFNLVSADEVAKLAEGDGGGRVQR